jgi:alkylated DNA repair dioxygenase AlkB
MDIFCRFFYFYIMNSLFPKEKIVFDLPDAEIEYYPDFFSREKAFELFTKLKTEIPWQQDKITVFGQTHLQPRLTALFGNDGKTYSYSNIIMQPHKWNPLLVFIKNEIEEICLENFTTVLLNLYRDGKDSNGWHADNEKELGKNPMIASVSFGAERSFHLQHNSIKEAKQKIILEHGSLLLMKGTTQHFWKHQIPKTKKPIGERINLTFRIIK